MNRLDSAGITFCFLLESCNEALDTPIKVPELNVSPPATPVFDFSESFGREDSSCDDIVINPDFRNEFLGRIVEPDDSVEYPPRVINPGNEWCTSVSIARTDVSWPELSLHNN